MKSKFLLFVFIAVATLKLPAQVLQNPSFEDAGATPDVAANWNRWGNWINRETDWSPTHSGTCLIGYHHWQVVDNQTSGIWQDVQNIKAGQRFTFSIWVYSDQTNSPASSIELRLEATVDGKQVTISSATTLVKDMPFNDWHQLTVTGTTPKDNLRVLFAVTPSAGNRDGAIKFDDASLDSAVDQPVTNPTQK
jgi:hypothetical protein